MTARTEHLPLPLTAPGTCRTLAVHHFGRPGARPLVYIQAGLHANEIPGMLVARQLAIRLAQAEAQGAVQGEVVLVPMANPIGLDQRVLGHGIGRYHIDQGDNFNRGFPDLTEAVATTVGPHLGPDAERNTALIREALTQALAALTPDHGLDGLRLALLRLAVNADLVLDLHCDQEALLHLYTDEEAWPVLVELAAWLGCRVAFLAKTSGGEPFDEACSQPWRRLAARFGPATPIPAACLASTIELRGLRDVDHELAACDAEALYRFLQTQGVIAGNPGPPPPRDCLALPLAGVARINAPTTGVFSLRSQIGDKVSPGQMVAEIIDPSAPPGADARQLLSPIEGIVWQHSLARFVHAGDTVLSLAGSTPLNNNRPLLGD